MQGYFINTQLFVNRALARLLVIRARALARFSYVSRS
jgi:hypothetical protein